MSEVNWSKVCFGTILKDIASDLTVMVIIYKAPSDRATVGKIRALILSAGRFGVDSGKVAHFSATAWVPAP